MLWYVWCVNFYDWCIVFMDYEKLRNWDWNIINVIGIEINIFFFDNFGLK